MQADSVLVIDAGTSALRAMIVRGSEVRTLAAEPWPTRTPDDGSAFSREFDATETVAALLRALDAAAPERDRITGIAITGQREGVVFADPAGEALLISPNIDGRAAMEGMAMDAAHRNRIYAVTGHLPALMQAPAKLAWLRGNRPDVAARVHRVLPLADWLASLLTGEQAMSRSLANEIGLIDVSTGAVAAPLLQALDLSPALVPGVIDDGATAGAARIEPFSGLPVALCGADTQCALAGMGVVDDGFAGVVAGWSTPVQMVARAPVLDAAQRIWTGLHVLPGRWVLESNAGDCGRAWEWVCSMMSLSIEQADGLVATAPPGAHDMMAVLGPAVMRASTMNVTTGAIAMPLPLALSSPSRADVARAALEAIAYAVRANLEQLEEIAGTHAGHLALGGGMSASAVFAEILASVVGRPVVPAASTQTSALGAAAIASPAFGLRDTIDGAAAQASRARTVEPDVRISATYDDCCERWRTMAALLESGAL